MRLLFLFGSMFICLTALGKPAVDTTDYWHVKVKGFQIAEFDETSPKPAVSLNTNKLTSSDLLSVKYGNDAPCCDCVTNLYVTDNKNSRIVLSEGKGSAAPLNVSIEKLKQLAKKLGKNTFAVFYTDGKRNRRLFMLDIGKSN